MLYRNPCLGKKCCCPEIDVLTESNRINVSCKSPLSWRKSLWMFSCVFWLCGVFFNLFCLIFLGFFAPACEFKEKLVANADFDNTVKEHLMMD